MDKKSALSGIRTLRQFEEVRWDFFHDVQTWKEFQAIAETGIISLESDSLGELLGVVNYFGRDDSITYALNEQIKNDDEYKLNLHFINKKIGVNVKGQQPCLVQVKLDEFTKFVEQWYDTQGKQKKWNPSYAKPLSQEKVYELAKGSPQRWLDRLSLPYDYDFPLYAEEVNIDKIKIDFFNKPRAQNIFLPFDHWTLAECFRRHYENEK